MFGVAPLSWCESVRHTKWEEGPRTGEKGCEDNTECEEKDGKETGKNCKEVKNRRKILRYIRSKTKNVTGISQQKNFAGNLVTESSEIAKELN